MNYGRAFEAIFSGFIKPASSALIRVFKHGTTDCESIAQNKDRARKGRSNRVVERPTEDALTLGSRHGGSKDEDTADRSIDGSTFKESGRERASSRTTSTSVIDSKVDYDNLKPPLGNSMLTDYLRRRVCAKGDGKVARVNITMILPIQGQWQTA